VTSHPVNHCVAGGLALTKDAGLTVDDVWARMESGRVGRRDRGSVAAYRAQAQPRDEAGRFTAEGVGREQARAAPITREQRVTPPSAVALPNGMAYAPDPETYAEIEEDNAAVRAGGGERVARPLSHQSRGAVV
jgi:hypothetical protein